MEEPGDKLQEILVSSFQKRAIKLCPITSDFSTVCVGVHWEEWQRQGKQITEQGETSPWDSSAETNARPLIASAGFLFLLLLGN